MRRRAFLATAGTLLSAGCGALTGGRNGGGSGDRGPEDWGDEDGPDFTARPERTLPEPPGGARNEYQINTEVDSEIRGVGGGDADIRDPFGVDEGRDGGTPTQANQEAAELIGEARNQLDDALAAYRGYAGANASITDVNASHTSFDNLTVEDRVSEAESTLDQAVESATDGQKMNIIGLAHVSVFIRYAARCQKALGDAFEEIEFMSERLYNESLRLVDQGNRQARSAIREARDAYQVIESEVEEDAFGAYGTLSEAIFREKVQQLDSEIAALDESRSGVRDMKDGVSELQAGVPAFLDERYEEAERRFSGASADFAIARTSFRLTSGSREVESKVREIIGVAQTLEQATADLRRAAQAQLNDERLVFYEARRAAQQHIESNEIVRGMRTMNDIVT